MKLLKRVANDRKDSTGKTYYEHMAEEPGRLRDKHPLDCGKAKCLCCHYEKVLGKKKVADRRIDDSKTKDE